MQASFVFYYFNISCYVRQVTATITAFIDVGPIYITVFSILKDSSKQNT